MENEVTNVQKENEGKTLGELWSILKNSLWIVFAIVILFTAGGVVYSFMEEPSYTSSRKVVFTCEINNGATTVNNIQTMNAYSDTIMDFCMTGVVLDRANRYYINYLNSPNDYKNVEEYVADLEIADNFGETGDKELENRIVVNNVKVNKKSDANSAQYAFTIQYVDSDPTLAYDKLKLLVYAYKKEISAKKDDGSEKYFGDFKVYIEDLDSPGLPSSNNSTIKNVIIFGGIGVLISLLVVYIKTISNKTITTKEELEQAVGAPIFAAISNIKE